MRQQLDNLGDALMDLGTELQKNAGKDRIFSAYNHLVDAYADLLRDAPEEDLDEEEALMALTATVGQLAERYVDVDPMDETDIRNFIELDELEEIISTNEILGPLG